MERVCVNLYPVFAFVFVCCVCLCIFATVPLQLCIYLCLCNGVCARVNLYPAFQADRAASGHVLHLQIDHHIEIHS